MGIFFRKETSEEHEATTKATSVTFIFWGFALFSHSIYVLYTEEVFLSPSSIILMSGLGLFFLISYLKPKRNKLSN